MFPLRWESSNVTIFTLIRRQTHSIFPNRSSFWKCSDPAKDRTKMSRSPCNSYYNIHRFLIDHVCDLVNEFPCRKRQIAQNNVCPRKKKKFVVKSLPFKFTDLFICEEWTKFIFVKGMQVRIKRSLLIAVNAQCVFNYFLIRCQDDQRASGFDNF